MVLSYISTWMFSKLLFDIYKQNNWYNKRIDFIYKTRIIYQWFKLDESDQIKNIKLQTMWNKIFSMYFGNIFFV